MKTFKKIIAKKSSFIWWLLTIWLLSFVVLADSIDIDPGFFSGSLSWAANNVAEINFHYAGNSSNGIMFLLDSVTIPAEVVNITGTSESVSCTKQLRGMYYSSARGSRMRPLDQATLSIFTGLSTGYNLMTMTGGLYTSCSGTGAVTGAVYGEIKHTMQAVDYYLNAGTHYNFTSGTMLPILTGNLIFTESSTKIISGFLHDTYGGIGQINSISMTMWTGNTIKYLTGGLFYTGTIRYTANPTITYSINYYNAPFTSTYTLTGSITTNPSWSISWTGITTGTVTLSGEGIRTFGATFAYQTTKYTTNISGPYLDQTSPTVPVITKWCTWTYNIGERAIGRNTSTDAGAGISGYIYQVATDSSFIWLVANKFVTGITAEVMQNTSFLTGTFYLRILAKDNVGNNSATSASCQATITGSIDTQVDDFTLGSKTNAKLSTVYKSRTITITGLTRNLEVPISVDAAINKGILFINSAPIGTTWSVKNGDEVYIELISSNEYEKVVSSKLTIWIGNNKKEATFKITTMQKNPTNYSEMQYNRIRALTLFKQVLKTYQTRQKELVDLMGTYASMTQDRIDEIADTTDSSSLLLTYFKELVNQWIEENVAIAPNGKKYLITYSDVRKAFTSPNFVSTKYFPDKARILDHINRNNPAGSAAIHAAAGAGIPVASRNHRVDFNFASIDYTAPNGKIYTIGKTTEGKYFSYKFIYPRYFNSVEEMKWYINLQNPKK